MSKFKRKQYLDLKFYSEVDNIHYLMLIQDNNILIYDELEETLIDKVIITYSELDEILLNVTPRINNNTILEKFKNQFSYSVMGAFD